MGSAIFELEKIGELPLWAQVLIASRVAKRAVLALPNSVDAQTRATLLEGCDAIERCAVAGEWIKAERQAIERAMELHPSGAAGAVGMALYYAADAAHAAHDSLDFSAAQSACVSSARKSMQASMGASGVNPLQVMTFMAADLETVRFACKEGGVRTYDGVGKYVMERICPVYAPENGELPEPPMER